MKKWLIAALCLILALPCVSLAEERTEVELSDYLEQQAAVDDALMAEAAYGYDFDDPLVVVNPYGSAPLSALAIFTTDEAVGGSVTAKGKAPEDDITGTIEAAKVHCVPILGLYPGGVTEVALTLDDGRETTLRVETEALELAAGNVQAQMFDADSYDYSQLTVAMLAGNRGYAAFDSKGDARWAFLNTGFQGHVALDNGHLLVGTAERYSYMNWWSNGLREIDALGRVYSEYVFPGGTHHDFIQLPDGHYLAVSDTPGELDSEDYLVEIDPSTGEVVWDLELDALIDRDDGGAFGQYDTDWAHINAVCYDADSDLLLISCRHLSAVVAVHKAEKTLAWVLSDPAGWEKLDSSLLLKPVGSDFEWPYGQHEVTLLPDGTIMLFDNGYGGRAKLPNAEAALPDGENYSRAVRYRVDLEAMTVEQVWQYGKQLGPRYYSSSRSGAVAVDGEADAYLIDFGVCRLDYDGSLGIPGNCTYIQYLVDDAPVWELSYVGMTYRAFRGNPYDFGGSFDPTATPSRYGHISDTPTISAEMSDETLPLPLDLELRRLPYDALRVSGTQVMPKVSGALDDYAVILEDSNGGRIGFELFYYTARDALEKIQNVGEPVAAAVTEQINGAIAAVPDGTIAFLDGWISLRGLPKDTYALYIQLNGVVYDTGKQITL